MTALAGFCGQLVIGALQGNRVCAGCQLAGNQCLRLGAEALMECLTESLLIGFSRFFLIHDAFSCSMMPLPTTRSPS